MISRHNQNLAIQIGQGARGAVAEVEAVADVLGAGVSKALLGKNVLSDELPWVTGSNGLLGTRATYEMMRDCDTLLVIGSSFPYSQFLPKTDRSWRETIERNVARWWEVMARRAGVEADPINPELVLHELSPLLPEDVMISVQP